MEGFTSSFGSKSKIGKKFSSSSFDKSQGESTRHEPEEFTKSMGSTKKIGEEEKGFVFSLSQFDEKSKPGKLKQAKIESTSPQPEKRTSIDTEQQSRRGMIYGNQSFKEKFEENFPSSVESNNDLFSMVFLNKKKQQQMEQPQQPSVPSVVPPASSFSKSKSKQVIEEPQEFTLKVQDFDLGRKLGAGKFGQVFIARHKGTGFVCALKKISKANVDSKLVVQLVRQIKIQSFLNHANIVKMYAFFSDKNFIYLALQLCFSGQLYDFLKKKRKVPQDMAKNIVQQICKALDYMHENQIIHRDLKPENVIYHCGLLKLCDFGWSISTNTMRQTFCGTPLYVSPELLKRKTYNNKIDVWSVGILTYELLFGRVPFDITTEQDFVKIVQDQIKFSKATKVSDQAKDFILICLQKDPRDRFTIAQLLDHPFLAQVENVSMVELY